MKAVLSEKEQCESVLIGGRIWHAPAAHYRHDPQVPGAHPWTATAGVVVRSAAAARGDGGVGEHALPARTGAGIYG